MDLKLPITQLANYQVTLAMENTCKTYAKLENWFDRKTYQNDFFFWFLILLYLVFYFLDYLNKVPEGSGYTTAMVVDVLAVSWIYTNGRRRVASRLKSGLFVLLTLLIPWLGGMIYSVVRPKELKVTELSTSKTYPVPVPVGDTALMLFQSPIRFLFKLVFWLFGLTFLLIGILQMCEKI